MACHVISCHIMSIRNKYVHHHLHKAIYKCYEIDNCLSLFAKQLSRVRFISHTARSREYSIIVTYLLPLRAFFSHTREAGQQPCFLELMAMEESLALGDVLEEPLVEDELELSPESISNSPPSNGQVWLSYILCNCIAEESSHRADCTIFVSGK